MVGLYGFPVIGSTPSRVTYSTSCATIPRRDGFSDAVVSQQTLRHPVSLDRFAHDPDRVPRGSRSRRGTDRAATSDISTRVGLPVSVRVDAEAQARGVIVELRLDTTGAGALSDPVAIRPGTSVAYDVETVFTEPGTYFLAVRATAQTAGEANDSHARVHNIARARVTVAL